MLGLKDVPKHELVALKFEDERAFQSAARRAATARIAVEAPGRNTLIISRTSQAVFDGLKYETAPIAQKVSDQERGQLRLRRFK